MFLFVVLFFERKTLTHFVHFVPHSGQAKNVSFMVSFGTEYYTLHCVVASGLFVCRFRL